MSRTDERERLFAGAIHQLVGAVMLLVFTALGAPWYLVLTSYVGIIAWCGWKLSREPVA